MMCSRVSNLLRLLSNVGRQEILIGSKRNLHFKGHQLNSKTNFSKYLKASSLCGGIILLGAYHLHKNTFKAVSAAQKVGGDGGDLSRRFNFIADVVEKTSPAVVFIEVKGRHPFGGMYVSISSGSGFIISHDGLILTNAHVVANSRTVSVKLQDGRIFEGVVEFVDELADLATIRVSANHLPIIRLGDSRKLRPGEWVFAMGSPFSLSNTITIGVASSVHRPGKELGLHGKEMEYIQTDAYINVGNSGGPLVNLDGEAIGINTMRVTAGISFAIPSSYAIEFLTKADSHRKTWFGTSKSPPVPTRKKYIGVTMLTLTPALAEQYRSREANFPNISKGVLVLKVVLGSPAHLQGLQPGDVITHINNSEARSAKDIYTAIDSGNDLKLKIIRNDRELSLTITPQSRT